MCTRIVSSFEILIFKNVAFSDRTFYRKTYCKRDRQKKRLSVHVVNLHLVPCVTKLVVCVLPFALPKKKKKTNFHCVKNWPTTSITRSVSSRCDIWLDSLNSYPKKCQVNNKRTGKSEKTYRKLNPFNSRNIVEEWINSCLSCFVVSTIS